MNKVYRISWHDSTGTWTVGPDSARVRDKDPRCLTLSGIAVVVSLGVPFCEIAQAAPSANYMVASSREMALPPGLAGNVSYLDRDGIATRWGRALVHANQAPSSNDFWRHAHARDGLREVRTVAGQETARKQPSRKKARKKKIVASTAPREGRTTRRAERGTTTARTNAAARHAARHSQARYDSTRRAMSAPFYNVVRRPEPSLTRIDDYRTTGARPVAPWVAGHAQHYLRAADTKPVGRIDDVPDVQPGVRDTHQASDANGVSDRSNALSGDANPPLAGSANHVSSDAGTVAVKADRVVAAYASDPWKASGGAAEVRLSVASQPIQRADIKTATDAEVDGAPAENVVDATTCSVVATDPPPTTAVPQSGEAAGEKPGLATAEAGSHEANATADQSASPEDSPASRASVDPTAGTPAIAATDATDASATQPRTATSPDATVHDDAKIRAISFEGNAAFGSKVLREAMQLSPTNWGSWYTKNDVYSKDRLTEGLERIRQYYLDRGYLEYRVESVQTSPSTDGKGVEIAIAVHEGEPYTLSAVRVSGGPPELAAELDSLNELRTGGYVSAGKLLASTRAIAGRLGTHGYLYAAVNPLSNVDTVNHSVDMTLQVDPGRRVTVRRVEVTGNTITRDEVIRREVRQMEQEGYDAAKVVASRDRLDGLGYFSSVDVKTVPVPGSPGQVDVDVNVVEKPGAALRFGTGYSTTDRVVVSAGITSKNVLGTGQSVSANISAAKPFRTLDVTQTDPWFTSGAVSRTTSAYYRTNEPLYYSSDSRFRVVTQGLDTRFGIPLSDTDRVSTGMAIEHNRLNPDALTPQNYIDYIGRYGRESTNVPIMAGWTRDTRNSATRASRGYLVHAGVEYGTPIGGSQYYKADVGARYYHAFTTDIVLAMRLQGGYGGGVGNKPYPVFKNYYVGGIGSVRGFEPNSLSPRDLQTGQPIGGSKMLTTTAELKLPVPLPDGGNRLNAFTFVDGGNAWGAQGASIASNGMRFSYGVGLAWNSPAGALKVSAGFPIGRKQFDRYQPFQMQFEAVF
ncbi:outer membrane protein assembly factor BamA [Paraburkholderia mimosarum]|uniref:outer membrane protein assembly factor BamA n=1 Tax=Paraburkholderia mimosarum TaxID=312026 RepID=UPI00041A56F2|nr:outer membrane protein assembly factor BamA [Paraburkholderia mimosarum]